MSAYLRWRQNRRILQAAAREDDFLENERARRQRRISRRLLRLSVDPFGLPNAEFIKTFRLDKPAVRELANLLKPLLPNGQRCDGISAVSKVLIALSFLATGSYQTLIGQSAFHNISQSAVSRTLKQVIKALNHNSIYNKYVKWPQEIQERNAIKAKFYEKFKIPGVLGCIDGSHVAIIRPQQHEERYFNRKGYHSLNVMIICDSDLNILCVDPSTPGSAHDSRVWQSHPLCSYMTRLSNDGEQVYLLGDSGYALRKTLMTPILNALEGTPDNFYYNLHVSARNTVERCIGVLKARFRCLLVARALHYNPITAGNIVNACCVLHNIANLKRVPVVPLTTEEADVESQLQILIQEELRAGADLILQTDALRNSRVNRDLVEGRALQKALVHKLWRDK